MNSLMDTINESIDVYGPLPLGPLLWALLWGLSLGHLGSRALGSREPWTSEYAELSQDISLQLQWQRCHTPKCSKQRNWALVT
jgi:hypothetical protein